MNTKPGVLALALLTLIFAILVPPEGHPSGMMAIMLCATFSFVIAIAERKIPSRFLFGGLAVFGILLAHTFWVSMDWYRSLEFLALLWVYYCLLGFFIYLGFGSLRYAAGVVIVLATVVSLYAVFQYLRS